jgi:mutual gliding-motility protein MglA
MLRRVVLGVAILLALAGPAAASFINYTSREINCKIVYWSSAALPRASHASLTYLHGKIESGSKGKLIELEIETEPTEKMLFFDFLPAKLGEIRGFKLRLHLYTAPVAEAYAASRSLILKGVDAIVVIVDADPRSAKANAASLASLKKHLADDGYDYDKVPIAFQVHNTAKKGALSVATLAKSLGFGDRPVAIADPTTGIADALKAVTKLVLVELRKPERAPAK